LIVALFAIGLWGADTPLFAAQSPAPPAPTVVAEVTQRTVPLYDEFVARTQAVHTVELRARVEGFPEQVLFREGSMVKEGQLLFVIERRPYEAALQSAKAQLAQAQTDLTRAQEHSRSSRPSARSPMRSWNIASNGSSASSRRR
jgi:multidrug efflux pump subunit AcrA (membrane-fusion protein)